MSGSPKWLEMPLAKPFYEALIEHGTAGAWAPEAMLALMAAESDLTPTARNRYNFAGLSQLGERELSSLGYEPAKMGPFELASPVVQVKFTAAFFAGWRKRHRIVEWESAGMMLACNLAPAHLGREDRVVYTLIDHPVQYKANSLVDRDDDGRITWSDCSAYIDYVCRDRCPARFQLALSGLAITRHELAMSALDAQAREASEDHSVLVSDGRSYGVKPPKGTA